jgi:hypothetical protein
MNVSPLGLIMGILFVVMGIITLVTSVGKP